MVKRWRQLIVFGGGLLLGVAAGATLFLATKNWQSAQQARAAEAREQAAVAPASACTEAPLLTPAGAQDGQFGPPSDPTDKTRSDIAAYLSVGSHAASQGRAQDAEISLITACRIAGHLGGEHSPELADAMYQLGRLYLAVAAADPAGALREAVLGRAESLFAKSVEAFAAELGQPHEKTRLAAAALTLARQAQALAGPLQAQAEQAAAAASAPVAQAPASAASGPAAAATTAMGGPPARKARRLQPEPEEAQPEDEPAKPVLRRSRPAPPSEPAAEPSPASGSAQADSPSEPEYESP
jgi:hypothetical protein